MRIPGIRPPTLNPVSYLPLRAADLTRGPLGLALAPLGWLYRLVARLRVRTYRSGWRKSHRPPMPTLSIGNISAGGTGKTPLMLHATHWLEDAGAKVGVLSRGYGGDEGRLLEAQHPQTILVENPNRVEGLATLQSRGGADVLLLDDGFQHLKIQRDLDVVVIDATHPFGRCLPAGLFREGPQALRRAHAIVLSRTELVDTAKVEQIWQRVDQIRHGLPDLPRLEGGMQMCDLRRLHDGELRQPDQLQDFQAYLSAGIGNPESFRALCESNGIGVVGVNWKGDHHAWQISDTQAWAQYSNVIVTEKDAVKLQDCPLETVWELRARWVFHRGLEDWENLLNFFYLPVRAAQIEPLWSAHDPEGRRVS
jgi:tetraacyldisaccharide 4'-kinase